MVDIRMGTLFHRVPVIAAMIAMAGCAHRGIGSESSTVVASPAGLAAGEYRHSEVTDVVAAGGTYHIRVSGRFHAPYDVLVDFADRTGSYASGRITVPAGDFYDERIAVTLPLAVRDPESTFFSVKVQDVHRVPKQYLDVNNLKVTWLTPRRLTTPLFFPGDVMTWDYSFTRNYSNHDGWTVRVGLAEDGRFKGENVIAAHYFGMMGDSNDCRLNLATGELYFLQIPEANRSLSPIEKSLPFPRNNEEKTAWMAVLNELISNVDYVADSKGQGSQPFLEYPSLKNTSEYLHRLAEHMNRE